MDASGTDSLIFIDHVTHDGRSRMNSVYRSMLSANLQRNASDLIGRNLITQRDNEPKHTANNTQDSIRDNTGKF